MFSTNLFPDKSTNGLTVSNEFDKYTENLKSTLCTHNNTSINNTEHNEWFDEIKLPYQYLSEATNGFSESCLIGAGGFSKVFKSRLNLKQNNQIVAIKRLEHDFNIKDFKQYLNEICIVLKFKHDNVLPLLAISYDEQPCFIYEFMENGSLLENIACDIKSILLDWKLRIQIGTDIARGIVYLHTEFETPFIHRDIKTANILLDNKFIAKIGDFGLMRIGNHTMTSVVCGTSAYMSPEAFRGDISVKVDVFSFGIVLLELLTGLAPIDKSRTGYDLLTHINEIEWPVEKLLDKRAGNWDNSIAEKIYDLAQICCTATKSQRPVMHGQDGVLESLKNIQSEN
ncbi:Hypothetical protein CINCED_3A025831 [Cinara cedri]|uniref:non-specific serine/threonine protein kinase n=1 Tax=Cinara cedri TaxID=506608 RepID=A0A5E4NKQ1_9HEMI|nr:Hypothetical protein CINCED_3A025831 [Cinara cedri]